jgi:hypothetical protein
VRPASAERSIGSHAARRRSAAERPGPADLRRIPLVGGRTFDTRDRNGAPFATVVNQELANRVFPGEDPVGKRLHILWRHPQATYEIVGVVGSVRHIGLDRSPEPALFLANLQESGAFLHLVIRASGDPMRLAPAVKSVIRSIERDVPVSSARRWNSTWNARSRGLASTWS